MIKRIIEEFFPIKEISELSAREKSIRFGHISTLHLWWSRKPLASSRATIFSSLLPPPEDSSAKSQMNRFIIELCRWENSLSPEFQREAREKIKEWWPTSHPKILDPFAGGGSIPLEAVRLGCHVYASDYNPISVLLLKCTLVYPFKFSDCPSSSLKEGERCPVLLAGIERWGRQILEEARAELQEFYPEEEEMWRPAGYYWINVINCPNPLCGVQLPLTANWWLSNRERRKIALVPKWKKNRLKFEIRGDGFRPLPKDFDPSKGTVIRGRAVCPKCRGTIESAKIRELFQRGEAEEKLAAVILRHPRKRGKKYRLADKRDEDIFCRAREFLKEKAESLRKKWKLPPIPQEPLPAQKTLGFSVQNYGITKWKDLFNPRQLLANLVFTEKVRNIYRKILANGGSEEFATAVTSYLALVLSRMIDKNSRLTLYNTRGEKIEHTFTRQAISMVWDYAELNPLSGGNGDWMSNLRWVKRSLEHLCAMNCLFRGEKPPVPTVMRTSAHQLPFEDNFFDGIFTDPPYYDNIPYSHLSDYFYIWLKRALGELHADLFATPLTPKQKEIVAYGEIHKTAKFEEKLKESFRELYRVLKPDGIAVIVYTHKSAAGWEALINSLLSSGLVVTGAIPLETEKRGRLRAQASAALASSIYLICRKIEKKKIGWFSHLKRELQIMFEKKLPKLWENGIRGSDYFLSALGSAIEIFGRYEKVLDFSGKTVTTGEFLNYVREEVTRQTIRYLLNLGIDEYPPFTRFYLLWRWSFGEGKISFDQARKLAYSAGLNDNFLYHSLLYKNKGTVRLLSPQDRTLSQLTPSKEPIEQLHRLLLLWKAGNYTEIERFFEEEKESKGKLLRLAQAISETLPFPSAEKKLLDGFLAHYR